MSLRNCVRFAVALLAASVAGSALAAAPMKALIIDGQNNHGAWPKTTVMMKSYLEETGLFTVDVARTKFTVNGENGASWAVHGIDGTRLNYPMPIDPSELLLTDQLFLSEARFDEEGDGIAALA